MYLSLLPTILPLYRVFGPLFDVYIPRDFYTKRPRGFAYVQFEEPEDAADAQARLNHSLLYERRLEVLLRDGFKREELYVFV